MTEAVAADLPAFPVARTCPFAPPERYARLRAEQPVSEVRLPSGRTAWVVATHALVRQALTDPRLSSDRLKPGFPLLLPIPTEALAKLTPSLLGIDPPKHTLHRRMVITEFTVKRVRALRPHIQRGVDAAIDAMIAGPRPVDLVRALSLPVPTQLICELLGVPYRDRELFQAITKLITSRTSTAEERGRANAELTAYLELLVATNEATPDDGLIGRLVVRYREADRYDRAELVGLARLLLLAGHETTANMISLGVVALLENPRQLADFKADPALAGQTVEELLRFFSVAELISARVATEDLRLGDVVVRAGEGVIALGGAANHDETVFPRPGTVDIHRNARRHVAFGYGIHQCLGQNLARLELEVVYGTLFRRLPDLRLAVPVERLRFKHDSEIYGIHEVPVTW
ncbi:cytochrome P450 [Actinosynnema sp. NPDC020468]|uniref:cytochrome P450 n=1 Tax=Actinosynnema sp. NPDC020468 TaxID=3154488 RepID=UPI0033CED7E6